MTEREQANEWLAQLHDARQEINSLRLEMRECHGESSPFADDIAGAVMAERAACLKIAIDAVAGCGPDCGCAHCFVAERIATAIRARGAA